MSGMLPLFGQPPAEPHPPSPACAVCGVKPAPFGFGNARVFVWTYSEHRAAGNAWRTDAEIVERLYDLHRRAAVEGLP